MHDAVQLLAKALHEMDRSQEVSLKPLACDGVDSWASGINVVNYMKLVTTFIFYIYSCFSSQ